MCCLKVETKVCEIEVPCLWVTPGSYFSYAEDCYVVKVSCSVPADFEGEDWEVLENIENEESYFQLL